MRRLLRLAASCALLAAALASNFARHDHSFLQNGEETALSTPADRFLTRHNPLSRAAHWHAVLAVVHEHDCVACHNQRHVAPPAYSHEARPIQAKTAVYRLVPAKALAISCLLTASRAPPGLH